MTMIKSKIVIVSFYTMYISFFGAGERGGLKHFSFNISLPLYNSSSFLKKHRTFPSVTLAYEHTHYSKQDPGGKKRKKISHAHTPYRLFSGYSYT